MNYFKTSNLSRIERAQERGNVALCILVCFGLLLLSFFYLAQNNALVAKNFELRSIQKTLDNGRQKNQQLSISLAKTQSLANLEIKAKEFNLVPIEQARYLKASAGFFAVSR